jgi:hypothetical protein
MPVSDPYDEDLSELIHICSECGDCFPGEGNLHHHLGYVHQIYTDDD